jgi:hypothetical protein
MTSFPLFTSIKPSVDAGELSYLRCCLDSWRAAGFDAVAVNGPSEIKILRGLDLPVEFIPLPTDGKPRIGAILAAIRESGSSFAGIINADCKLIGYPNLIANLGAGLDKTVVLAWRIDTGVDGNPTTQRGGFDAYFFDTSVLPDDDSGFSIGDPWWDHWFPIACEMKGALLETLAVPLLMHKEHPENWDREAMLSAGRRFWVMLRSWHRRGGIPNSLLAKLPDGLSIESVPSDEQIWRLSLTTPSWLQERRPQTISILGPGSSDIETALRLGGLAIRKEVYWQPIEEDPSTYRKQLRPALPNQHRHIGWRKKQMAVFSHFVKRLHHWRRRFLPPSSAEIRWRHELICARLDKIEKTISNRFPETTLSPRLQGEILTVLRLLEPKKIGDYVKVRVGSDGDGGYVQIDDLVGISHAFSFGIADNDDWDLAMAKAGIPVEQFDHSVENAPSSHPLLHFHHKMISTKATAETATVAELVTEHSKLSTPDLILKMDIEDGEWDVLDDVPEAILTKFAQIVCEFHNLSHLANFAFRDRARRVFEKLDRYFIPVHVHGNNCCELVNVCNIPLPDFLEVTFASRARYSFVESNETFPTALDAPNCPHLAPIVLGTFRF